MSIDPTRFQLKRSAIEHKKTAQNSNTLSAKLLWFYSTECALKSLYLKKNSLPIFTSRLAKNFGHNLSKLSKECAIPNNTRPVVALSGVNYPIHEFHERLRYGVNLPLNIENSQLTYIKQVNSVVINLI
jgi:hypothetical protein